MNDLSSGEAVCSKMANLDNLGYEQFWQFIFAGHVGAVDQYLNFLHLQKIIIRWLRQWNFPFLYLRIMPNSNRKAKYVPTKPLNVSKSTVTFVRLIALTSVTRLNDSWKFFGDMVFHKRSQFAWWIFGLRWKATLFKVKLLWLLFGQLLEILGYFFNLASGHSGFNERTMDGLLTFSPHFEGPIRSEHQWWGSNPIIGKNYIDHLFTVNCI